MTTRQGKAIARANVLGIGVHAVEMDLAIAAMRSAVEGGRKGYVCLAGAHGIVESLENPALQRIFDGALLVAPDGMPAVWMGRMQGLGTMRRVFGPDLMLEAVGRRDLAGWRHFLCGGAPGVAEQLQEALLRRFPWTSIVGTYTPPFREMNAEEDADLVKRIRQAKPDVVWVGMSTPKQEVFMARWLPLLETRLMVGVGAAFLYHTGAIRDSPAWVKAAGLQWLHRLVQEPKRLRRRYFNCVPRFLFHAAMQIAGSPGYEMRPALGVSARTPGPLSTPSLRGTPWQ